MVGIKIRNRKGSKLSPKGKIGTVRAGEVVYQIQIQIIYFVTKKTQEGKLQGNVENKHKNTNLKRNNEKCKCAK
jgi:hypothetical protein